MKRSVALMRWAAAGVVVLPVLAAVAASAGSFAVPDYRLTINVQGVLRDSLGIPVGDGIHTVTFRLYHDSIGGTPELESTQSVTTKGGNFTTPLYVDSAIAVPRIGPIPVDGIRRDFLSLQLSLEPEMLPRIPIYPVPYSIATVRVQGDFFSSFGQVAVTGDTIDYYPQIALLAKDTMGFANSPARILLKDTSGTVTADISSMGEARFSGNVAGQRGNFGYQSSNVGATAFVAGQSCIASGDWSSVGGGRNNRARGAYSVVSGGGESTQADSNSALGAHSAIGGGHRNVASNNISNITGGYSNLASGHGSVVTGGDDNEASGNRSAALGGWSNIASGDQSVTVGGFDNLASGSRSFAAGDQCRATGNYSSAIGGSLNFSSGSFAVSIGNRARAEHNGAIVIAANKEAVTMDSVVSSGVEQFVMRADGGFYLTNTSGSAVIPAGTFLNTVTGASLTTGGTWANSSDRHQKANLESVDGTEILKKLAAIPITTWNYSAQAEAVRHIGPMAQDFHAAFGVGEDDKHITTIDADGVALAAIQELYRKTVQLEGQQAEIKMLQGMVRALEARVEALIQTREGTK